MQTSQVHIGGSEKPTGSKFFQYYMVADCHKCNVSVMRHVAAELYVVEDDWSPSVRCHWCGMAWPNFVVYGGSVMRHEVNSFDPCEKQCQLEVGEFGAPSGLLQRPGTFANLFKSATAPGPCQGSVVGTGSELQQLRRLQLPSRKNMAELQFQSQSEAKRSRVEPHSGGTNASGSGIVATASSSSASAALPNCMWCMKPMGQCGCSNSGNSS